MYGVSKNSHKKQKDSLETRTVLIEIFLLLKFTERPKTPEMTSKKNISFPDSLKIIGFLQVILVLTWMKQTLICFNLQRDGTGNGLSNIKDAFAESLQLQISVLHQSMSIFHSSGLVSKVHDDWAKCQEKLPDVSDLNQNVETTCNFKLKFT